MDETYIKVEGHWLLVSLLLLLARQNVVGSYALYLKQWDCFAHWRNRDVNAAKTFLRSAMKNMRKPTKITLDAYAASHRAVREMKETGELSWTAFSVFPQGISRFPCCTCAGFSLKHSSGRSEQSTKTIATP